MAAPSEEKLCDKFNLEALTVNQVEDSRFNLSLVTATSTRIQSEDVLHGAHVIDEM
jgi:riboflavin synthase alpha subunit